MMMFSEGTKLAIIADICLNLMFARTQGQMDIFSNHPLYTFNTFGIEAFAKEFIEVTKDEELKQLVENQKLGSKQLLFLGGGSNILFTGDFHGTVIKISTQGKEIIKEDEEFVLLKVAAGEDWDDLVEYCVNRGWGGLENLSGIPGQVGSSPIQNIGAYGAEMRDHFESLEGLSLCTGELFTYDAERCQFGYRDSIFKRAMKGRVVITHVIFRLNKKPVYNLAYEALKMKLDPFAEDKITLPSIRKAVLEIRASKLPDPKVFGNAGSFFKNPVVGAKQLDDLKEKFPGIVSFTVPNSKFQIPDSENITADRRPPTADFKLAAGWLIEQCGWKGYREGDAGVHKDQALVLVNYGKASGMNILELAGKIQRSVKDKFGVLLEREVNVV
jgi:UDP-N-acetylmuramate dehydrogenase